MVDSTTAPHFLPSPDEVVPITATTGSGTMFVYLARGRAEIRHPILLAQGFQLGPPQRDFYGVFNQHGTADALREAGYDVLLFAFDDGGARIEHNAEVFSACLEAVKRRTPRPLVVGGFSMGGLVSRYALAAMERAGLSHQTRIFLTIDTPHRGAYTSLAAQWLAQTFAPYSPMAAQVVQSLDAPANQQFVMRWLHDGQAAESPLRVRFKEALERLGGYPRQPLRLAIASGSGDGRRTIDPQASAVLWTGGERGCARLWTLPEGEHPAVIARGQLPSGEPVELSVSSAVSWEGAPGGQNVYLEDAASIARSLGSGEVRERIRSSCSVPTVSALDLDLDPWQAVPPPGTPLSPFDDFMCCDSNHDHMRFTEAVRDWLIDRLGPPPQDPNCSATPPPKE
ncbi:MAG: hypothetical protein VKP70_00875 [Cyanobacteriota bacterium]|nr:hypothetical protein [Cyanobacteriota bacterium]